MTGFELLEVFAAAFIGVRCKRCGGGLSKQPPESGFTVWNLLDLAVAAEDHLATCEPVIDEPDRLPFPA